MGKRGKKAVTPDTLVNRTIASDSPVGRALTAWREELIADLGGPEVVSVQQRTIVELAARSKLILDSIDAWVFSQSTLINKFSKKLYAVVTERQSIANGLANYMNQLGLQRRTKPVQDLTAYLASKYDKPAPSSKEPPDRPVVIEHKGKRTPVITMEGEEGSQ